MEKILNNGFLDEEMYYKIIEVKCKYKKYFKILDDINFLFYEIIDNFKGTYLNNEKMYVFPAFVQLGKLYQSAVIMLSYGIDISFEIILRTILELSIKIRYALVNTINIAKMKKNHTWN